MGHHHRLMGHHHRLMGHHHRHPLRWALCALACAAVATAPFVPAVAAQAAQRATAPSHVLRIGDHGPQVAQLQRMLGITADGIFGPGTRHAVTAFQHAHGLLADGQVGHHTWDALATLALRRVEIRRHHDGILELGEKGPAVREVQRLLHIRANGLYDRRTWRAVRRFQSHHGLFVGGAVGRHTLHALKAGAHHHPSGGSLGARAAHLSRSFSGIRYVWGGSRPRQGFDCSGLVQWVYGRLGVDLPRVTYQQWHAGRHVRHRANLRPGDLVFFHHLGHVGIFLGHGWFISAPHSGERVHASRLTGWYLRHYQGGVRVR